MRLLRGQVPLVLDEYDYKSELGCAKRLRAVAMTHCVDFQRLNDNAHA